MTARRIMECKAVLAPVATLLVLTCCGPSGPSKSEVPKDSLTATNSSQLAQAFNSGKVTFEIRGLLNEKEGSSFVHKAMVIVTGDRQYAKGNYLVFFSIKHVGDGDPAQMACFRSSDSQRLEGY